MHDIQRRQYQSHGLTIISDVMFTFFLKLTEKCLKYLVDENLNKAGANLFQLVRSQLETDTEVYDLLKESVLSYEMDLDFEEDVGYLDVHVQIVFKKIIKIFLMVMIDQFRKDLIESFNISKKMAHRKEIRVSS
jgi:hypothetical protein